ncbi:hypothetical protein [Photobacterium sp. Hal280]|uniref:hypothetical protein n=1 Tax=Photobacterium sp. Hal280 TaxID=3035163 RepID=UPI00301C5C8C
MGELACYFDGSAVSQCRLDEQGDSASEKDPVTRFRKQGLSPVRLSLAGDSAF